MAAGCSWVSGDAHVGDDESVDVRWWPLAALPDMKPMLLDRIAAAVSDEAAARFRT